MHTMRRCARGNATPYQRFCPEKPILSKKRLFSNPAIYTYLGTRIQRLNSFRAMFQRYLLL